MEINKKELYLSPEVKIFEVKQEGVICDSGRLNSPNNYDDGGDPFAS